MLLRALETACAALFASESTPATWAINPNRMAPIASSGMSSGKTAISAMTSWIDTINAIRVDATICLMFIGFDPLSHPNVTYNETPNAVISFA